MKKGVTRMVLLIGKYAIKIPNSTYSHQNFLQGCYANWSERQFTKDFKYFPSFAQKVSPTLFCSWFGLLSVQKRVEPLAFNIKIIPGAKIYFKNICSDFKTENFGWLDYRIVCIDYV